VNFGDIVVVDFGVPIGSEAGFRRPGVVMTADAFLRYRPTTVFVAPLTTTVRTFPSHVAISPDQINGLSEPSWVQVEQLRAVALQRCSDPSGNVGPAIGHQLLDVLAMITGMP
jgi:mRNA interferase MazF